MDCKRTCSSTPFHSPIHPFSFCFATMTSSSSYYAIYSAPLDGDEPDYAEYRWPMKDIQIGPFSTMKRLLADLSAFFATEMGETCKFTSAQDVYDMCYFQWNFGKGLFGRDIRLVGNDEMIPHDSEMALQKKRESEEAYLKQRQEWEEQEAKRAEKQRLRMEKFEQNRRTSLPRACKRG